MVNSMSLLRDPAAAQEKAPAPLIMSYLLIVITFSIERFVVIGKASGTGNVDSFVRKIQSFLNAGNIDDLVYPPTIDRPDIF